MYPRTLVTQALPSGSQWMVMENKVFFVQHTGERDSGVPEEVNV